MKELSIEEKAKAYNEAIERAKGAHNSAKSDKENGVTYKITEYTIQLTETIFPELKESEDKKIRKGIIEFFRKEKLKLWSANEVKLYGSWIAWLEKQSKASKVEQAMREVEEKVEAFTEAHKGETSEEILAQVRGEQEPTNKVEPKFKEGDWVVCEAAPKFTGFKTGDVVQISNKETLKLFLMFEDCFRLWDISKDAKEGDVLSFDNEGSNYHSIGIFKRIASKNEPNGNTYRCYVRYGGFKEKLEIPQKNGDELHHCGTSAHPAVKEQRDTLFAKMKEAGYEWDAEKKELKKVEQKPNYCHHEVDLSGNSEEYRKAYYDGWNNCNQQHSQLSAEKPAWSEEDEDMFKSIIATCELTEQDRDSSPAKHLLEMQTNWLNSIKDRIQPKQEWSEEDENRINRLIAYFEDKESFTAEDDVVYANWLKSIRPQSQWKPSEEQIKALEAMLTVSPQSPVITSALLGLYEQLKKLRG